MSESQEDHRDIETSMQGRECRGYGPGRNTCCAQSAQAQTYKVLHAFIGRADGHTPWAGVIQDGKGNLYGTTQYGGPTDAGTLFRLNKTTGKETVLYSFCTATNCPDGSAPEAGVIQDGQGNLYGTTTCLSVGRSSGSTREYGSATAGEVSEREACSASASVAAGASPIARPKPAVRYRNRDE